MEHLEREIVASIAKADAPKLSERALLMKPIFSKAWHVALLILASCFVYSSSMAQGFPVDCPTSALGYTQATHKYSCQSALKLGVPNVLGNRLSIIGDNSNTEIVVIDAPVGQTVDLQSWRVNGIVKTDITSTGAIELNSLVFGTGSGGTISEVSGGSFSIATSTFGNGNIVLNANPVGSGLFLQTQGITRWNAVAAGHLLAGTNNSYDIGDSAATGKPRTGYFGTSVVAPKFLTSGTAPTVSTCGTGTVTANSTDEVGEVTAIGTTTCTVNFNVAWGTFVRCIAQDDSALTVIRVSAQTLSSFTVTGLTAGDKFVYMCKGS